MIDKNTFYFVPNSFIDVIKTDIGDRVMRTIISNQSTERMTLAVELGLPPIAGCIGVLNAEIEEQELSKLRIKQFVGYVIKQYMESLGYRETGKTQKIKLKNTFVKKGVMFERIEK